MRIRRSVVSTAVIALTIGVGSAHAQATGFKNSTGLSDPSTTITFDEILLAAGTPVSDQYAAYGITFLGMVYDAGAAGALQGIAGHYLGNFIPITNPFTMFFSNAISGVAFAMGTNPNDATTISAYNGSTLVGTFTSPSTYTDPNAYWGFTADNGASFDRIEVNVGGGGTADIDNIQMARSVTTAPEPATIALVGTGLFGLAAIVRRRRAAPPGFAAAHHLA